MILNQNFAEFYDVINLLICIFKKKNLDIAGMKRFVKMAKAVFFS